MCRCYRDGRDLPETFYVSFRFGGSVSMDVSWETVSIASGGEVESKEEEEEEELAAMKVKGKLTTRCQFINNYNCKYCLLLLLLRICNVSIT